MAWRMDYGPKDFCKGPAPIDTDFATGQIFAKGGGRFVYLASGNATGALTATAALFGWAVLGWSPGSRYVSGTYPSYVFTTDSSAVEKHLVKPLDPGSIFYMPADDTYAKATHKGKDCDLIGVNDGTAQVADIGTSSTNVLRIIDGDGTVVQVQVPDSKIQVG